MTDTQILGIDPGPMTDTQILGIDPGPTQSAYALIEAGTCTPTWFAKMDNEKLLRLLPTLHPACAAVEMVSSYGMAVGQTVFDTCVWVGRYQQVLVEGGIPTELIYQMAVRMHICHNGSAGYANVIRALVDRFAGDPRLGWGSYGKGTKNNPGWFHDFAGDVWQAYALAVVVNDRLAAEAPNVYPSILL